MNYSSIYNLCPILTEIKEKNRKDEKKKKKKKEEGKKKSSRYSRSFRADGVSSTRRITQTNRKTIRHHDRPETDESLCRES